MDYDFSGLCSDQLEKLSKRLAALNKAFVKDYKMSLGVISSPSLNDKWEEIFNEVNNLLTIQANQSEVLYTQTFNKIQKVLGQYL